MKPKILNGLFCTTATTLSKIPKNPYTFQGKITKLDAPIGKGVPVALHDRATGACLEITETNAESLVSFQNLDKTLSYYIVAIDTENLFQSIVYDLTWLTSDNFEYLPKLKQVDKLAQSPLKDFYNYIQERATLRSENLVFNVSVPSTLDDNTFVWNVSGNLTTDLIDDLPVYIFSSSPSRYIYLDSTPTSMGKPFTFEAFFNITNLSSSSTHYLFTQVSTGTSRHSLYVDNTGVLKFQRDYQSTSFNALTKIQQGVWYHVALAFNGSSFYLFVNGKLEAELVDTIGLQAFQNQFGIGHLVSGYMSNPKWFNTCRYVFDFEPVFEKFEKKIWNSLDEYKEQVVFKREDSELNPQGLLLDEAKNMPFTVGGTTVGSNKAVSIANTFVRSSAKSADYVLKTNDNFCIEMLFLIKTASATAPTLIGNQSTTSEWTTNNWAITVNHQNSRSKYALYRSGSTSLTSTYPVLIGELTHLAICKEGNQLYYYFNGFLVDTLTITGVIDNRTESYLAFGRDITYYIFDAKITKNTRRYVENFTPDFLQGWEDQKLALTLHNLLDYTFKNGLVNFESTLRPLLTDVILSKSKSVNGTRSAFFKNASLKIMSGFYVPNEVFTIEARVTVRTPEEDFVPIYQLATSSSNILLVGINASRQISIQLEDDEVVVLEDVLPEDFDHIVIQREGATFKVLLNGSLIWSEIFTKSFDLVIFSLCSTTIGPQLFAEAYVNNLAIYKNILKYSDSYEVPEEIVVVDPNTEPPPEVIINDFTTSALDFENGITDKIPTTTWQVLGNGVVTSTNPLLDESSFETKSLGDSLVTSTKVITGGATPFTIEFYAMVRSRYGAGDAAPLFTQALNIEAGEQAIQINSKVIYYFRASSHPSLPRNISSKTRVSNYEMFKVSLSYDSTCLRLFVNNKLEDIVGTAVGWNQTNTPFRLMESWILGYDSYKYGTNGLIDNVNIFNGTAKVREKDKYEDLLVIDLPFDGPNGSTKILDHGTGQAVWTARGNSTISTVEPFNGYSSMYFDGTNDYIETPPNESFVLKNLEDFTISFECKIVNTKDPSYIFSRRFSADRGETVPSTGPKNAYGITHSLSSGFGFFGWRTKSSTEEEALGNVSTGPTLTNRKYLVTFVRDKGVMHAYLDGVLKSTEVQLYEYDDASYITYIGKDKSPAYSCDANMYLKNFKMYKGVALHPDNNSYKVKLPFNSNLQEQYSNRVWTNNSVTFSTTESKFGTAGYFTGDSSSYLYSSANSLLNFKTNNFSIEMDVKPFGGRGGTATLLAPNNPSWSNGNCSIDCYNNGQIRAAMYHNNAEIVLGSSNLIDNNYYNVKFKRISDLGFLVVNDIVVDSKNLKAFNGTSPIFNFDQNGTLIGKAPWAGSGNIGFKGYIDNFEAYSEDLLNDSVTVYQTSNTDTVIAAESIHSTHRVGSVAENTYTTVVFEDSPPLADFIAELELYIKSDGYNHGILNFRTADYSLNNMDKFGYSAYISGNSLKFGKGTPWVQLATVDIPVALRNDQFHKMTVVVKGNLFKIYLDDVLYISVTDSTYTDASKFAWCTYFPPNWTSATSSRLKSITILNTDAKEVYSKNWKSKIEAASKIPAVYIPFESNTKNIGYIDLNPSSIGSLTFVTKANRIGYESGNGRYLSFTNHNIFNIGLTTDFYIEFDVYTYTSSVTASYWKKLFALTDNSVSVEMRKASNSTAQLWVMGVATVDNTYLQEKWVNIKIYRKALVMMCEIDGQIFQLPNKNIVSQGTNFIGNGLLNQSTDYFDGCFSKFKMFVGVSKPHDDYVDEAVLNVDFKPTGKAYLFKDNVEKSVIHPIKIDQRFYDAGQYACTFNGVDQFLQLGKNKYFDFGRDSFVMEFYFKPIADGTWNILLGNGAVNSDSTYAYIGVSENTNSNQPSKVYISVEGSNIYTSNAVSYSSINRLIVTRSGNIFTLVLNGVSTTGTLNVSANFNYNDKTQIGSTQVSNWVNHLFKGEIFSVKVFRNTSDPAVLTTDKDEIVELKDTGIWVQSVASVGSSNSWVAYNPQDTSFSTWINRYAGTWSFGLFEYIDLPSPNATLSYNGPHIIERDFLGSVFKVRATNGTWSSTSIGCNIEILDASNNVLAALKWYKDGTYRHAISYGASLTSQTRTGVVGSYPQTNGELVISNTGITFTNQATTNYNASFNYAKDLSTAKKLRITNLSSLYDYSGAGAAFFILEKLR